MRTPIAVIAFALLPSVLAAQGWIEPPGRRPHAPAVVKERTAVRVRIADRIAHVEVEEWFRNTGGGLAEGDYLYPLPGEAVFGGFSLFQGDQELRGETMDAGRARRIYEEIVRSKQDPALIELVGHGLLRARVFPIGAGETRRITLRYTQVLARAGDALQFRYTAGGRNAGALRPQGEDGPTGPRPAAERAPLTFELVAEDAGRYRDPFSPTHEVRVRREGGRLVVRPAAELAGDFSLFLPLSRGPIGVTVATHRPGGEDGYFMLTLSPGEARAAALPRDLTVVLDVSGSMAGSKMEEARQALRQLLGTLDRRDRFRLIAFGSRVESFGEGWSEPAGEELARARRWVDDLRAEGGTNIAGALEEAFRLEGAPGRLPLVVFLTDGLPTVGETGPERIAQQAERRRGEARVFAFGIGYDVNTYLLDRLSAAGRGTTQYLEPGEDVEAAVSALAAKIRHPVLTDLEIADAPVRLREIYPVALPDLFAGEELVIFGRYAAADDRTGEVALTGRRGERAERFAVRAAFPRRDRANDFIPRLWASRKIGALMQQLRLQGPNPELEEVIRQTALRYGILSEYTAYLVEEPVAAAAAPRDGRRPAAVLPREAPRSAPEQASGREAVRAATEAKMRREASSMAALDAAELRLEAQAAAGAGPEVRVVAGRRFALRDGLWSDLAHTPKSRVVAIEPFGEAYFRLVVLLPELQPVWSAFRQVLVAGADVSLRVAPGGARALPEAEIERLVRQFRGR